MKKKIAIAVIIICLLIIIPISFAIYCVNKLKPYTEIVGNSDVLKYLKPHYSYDDTNIRSYITERYYPKKETKELLKKVEPLLPAQKDLFNPDSEQKLQTYIDEVVPDNFKDFASYTQYNIKDKINRTKNLEKDLERYEKYGYPLPLTFETTKLTAIYWYLLSKYFFKFSDYENSLLLSQGIIYLSRDWEREYHYGMRAINKSFTLELNHIACNSILAWANKPKPNMSALSKKIANDILNLVNSDFPLSMNTKYERKYFEENINHNDLRHFHSKHHEYLTKQLMCSKTYFNILDEVYKSPLAFVDKPIYQIKNEFEDYNNKIKPLYATESKFDETINAVINPEKALTRVLLKSNPVDFVKAKKAYEQKLAEMELTAIALVINAFASENKRMPESISELSKWFGRELPKNRLTNQPYELDLKGKHILYNKGLDGVEDLNSKDTDDIYFDFSL